MAVEIEALKEHARSLEKSLDVLGDTLKPSAIHWVTNDDAGGDYCADCVDVRVEELRTKDSEGEYEWDGGWTPYEKDSAAACTRCGCTLDYCLTSHGVQAELDHFETIPYSQPLTAHEAYSVSLMLDAVLSSDDSEIVRRVVAVGEAAVAAMNAPTDDVQEDIASPSI